MVVSRPSLAHFALVFACIGFVYVAGVLNLKSDPISSFSEWNSLRHINLSSTGPSNPIGDVLKSIDAHSADHGPLYFVLLKYWRELVGGDLAALRLLSVFFGMFTLVFSYRLALIARDYSVALAAIFIAAFLSFLVYFTHEVRMYSLLPMLSALTAWLYWKVLSAPRSVPWWLWACLTLAAAAIVYVHYFGIILLAALGGYHLLFAPKNRRWLGICLAMILAGLLFTPWLPVAIKGLTERDVPSSDSLPLLESVLALANIFSNGLSIIVPIAAAILAYRLPRLRREQRYLLFLAFAIFAIMIAANEIMPLIIARRIRYTIILAVPWTCALAIGWSLLPRAALLRLPLALIWIAAFFVYTNSEFLSLYTNEKAALTKEVPHFEDFIYTLDWQPRDNEPIVSFHPSAELNSKIMQFYTANLPQARDLIHIHHGADGEILVRAWHLPNTTLEDIPINYDALWVIHNPQRTELSTLPAYADWFRQRYKPCKRYLELADSVIEYYVRTRLPCELLIAEQPFTISWDGGTELNNLVTRRDGDIFSFYFWWGRTVFNVYSLTLQAFDSAGEKVLQTDDFIGVPGPDIETLNIGELPPGDYMIKLIVYEYESRKGQPGTILSSQERFDREIDVLQVTVE